MKSNSFFLFPVSFTYNFIKLFKRKIYTFFLIFLLMQIVIPQHLQASKITWDLLSLSENSFVVSLSAPSVNSEEICHFAFSSYANARFSSILKFDNAGPSMNTLMPKRVSSGIYKTHFIQWLAFTLPESKRSDTLSGTLTVTFDTPVFQGLSKKSAKIEHGILTLPLRSKHLSKSKSNIPSKVPFNHSVRIEITEDGIYQITGKDLQNIGVPISSIPVHSYQLFFRDKEIPLLIIENSGNTLSPDASVLFYAKKLRGEQNYYEQFSGTGIYRLFWGTTPGNRIAWVSGDRRKDPNDYSTGMLIRAQDFSDSLHIEFDDDIRWLGNIADIPPVEVTQSSDFSDHIDNWYWGIIGDNNLTTFTFQLPSSSPDGFARIAVGLMGLTSIDSLAYDHQLEIFLNNNPAGSRSIAQWDGQREFVFTSDLFPAELLIDGDNTISFLTKNNAISDRSALNWINITYPRNYNVQNDNLLFKSSPSAEGSVIEYELRGFSSPDIEVWDLDKGRIFNNCIISKGSGRLRNTYTLLFQDSITYATTYFAQEINRRKSPDLITVDTLSNGWDTLLSVDYIAIAPDSFRNELSPLLQMHSNRGLKTAFISIDQIYNRFSWGIRDPEAIRTFLLYCLSKNPNHIPRYLLLAGDTSHDLDKKNKRLNLVPTHLSRIPGWGPGSNDSYFTLVNGDDKFPDISVGRFPARNRIDLKIMVEKTVKYISAPTRGFWKDNLLMLGGGEQEFTIFNDDMTNEIINESMNIIRMDADPDSRFYKDARFASSHIADQINAGVFMLNFNGHGGGNIWSDNNFFGYQDLSRLYNGTGGRLPIIFSFTCLTGFFESTHYRSLGEELLRNSESGAICFYGASAYTSRNGNMIMNRLMLENALNQKFSSIGELIDICELNILVRYGTQYVNLAQQYNLLGDPALPFELIPKSMELSLKENALKGNDSLVINGSCPPVTHGSVQLLVKSDDQEWHRITDAVNNGVFKSTIPIKPGAHTASGIVRAYAWNDTSEVRSWVKFSKDTIMVFDVSLSPQVPHYGDSIIVSCQISSDSTADVYCLYAESFTSAAPSFKGISMVHQEANVWTTSEQIPIRYSSNADGKLLLKFRITTEESSRESKTFRFNIAERPDLAFSNKKMNLSWSADSLRTEVQVINIGNAPIPSFSLSLNWSDNFIIQKAIKTYQYNQPLAPGKVISYSFAVPDTQGTIQYSAHLSANSDEITLQNNTIYGFSQLNRGTLQQPTDTLFSKQRGISLHPATPFSIPHIVFLFTDSITAPAPLKSSSSWADINGDVRKMSSAGCRPPLGNSDSLVWMFRTNTILSENQKTGSLSVMHYDSLLSHWVHFAGNASPLSGLVTCTSSTPGPFAPAILNDSRPPDIVVSVLGRTLDFVDYAAKDKPFSIFLSDPSEIIPSSVTLLTNNKLFPAENHSAIPINGDLEHISITAYPPTASALDSLTVSAKDFAGNIATRTFAYMPGKDLAIQFLSCHPNPFTTTIHPDGSLTKIRFAYSLSDVARSINLTIYTVSGRTVQSWDFSNLIGYQEIEWDGRDHEGYRIANGLYYAKMTVKNRLKKVKKVIKIAKMEGF